MRVGIDVVRVAVFDQSKQLLCSVDTQVFVERLFLGDPSVRGRAPTVTGVVSAGGAQSDASVH